MRLLVIGTIAFDTIETPFGTRTETLGGSATFLATAASYFCHTRMAGVIGEDFPKEHLDFLNSREVDTSGIETLPGKTFRWHGRYGNDLNVAHTLQTDLNVLLQFNPKLPDNYRDSEVVMLGNFDPTLQSAVLDQLDKPTFVAADTMNFWIDGAKEALIKTLSRVNLLSVNDAEARALSGEYNLVHAAEKIRQMGPQYVVVKRGEHGATLYSDDGIFSCAAFPLTTIQDPTGAGDSFAGGFLGFLTHFKRFDFDTLKQAMVAGSTTASFAVEDFSLDRFRTLTMNDFKTRYGQFIELTHFTSPYHS